MKQDFPEVKGKVIESVQFTADTDYYGICIRFQDKTGLAFTIESCGIVAFPSFADWTNGEEKTLKEYPPVRSTVSLETEARLKSE